MDEIILEPNIKDHISNILDEHSADILSIKVALLSMELCPYDVVSELVNSSIRYTEIEKLDILSIFFVEIEEDIIERVVSVDPLDDMKPETRHSFSSLNSKDENVLDVIGDNL